MRHIASTPFRSNPVSFPHEDPGCNEQPTYGLKAWNHIHNILCREEHSEANRRQICSWSTGSYELRMLYQGEKLCWCVNPDPSQCSKTPPSKQKWQFKQAGLNSVYVWHGVWKDGSSQRLRILPTAIGIKPRSFDKWLGKSDTGNIRRIDQCQVIALFQVSGSPFPLHILLDHQPGFS